MKSIIVASLASLIIVVGGYVLYLKQIVAARTDSVQTARVYTEEDVEAIEFMMQGLEERRSEVAKLEGRIKAMRVNFDAEKKTLVGEQHRLEQLLVDIGARTATLADNQEETLTRLAKMYEMMKPAEAAEIASGLSVDLLVEILPRMKQRAAAKLIAAMDTPRAVQITQRLGNLQQLN